MTGLRNDKETEVSTVQVDFYKIKIDARSADLGEEPPTSWRQVIEQIHHHLMRLASAPTRLIAETLEGVTRLVRGVSGVPEAISSRIERAHVHADAKETLAQERSLASAPHLGEEHEDAQLLSILDRCRVEGLLVKTMRGPGGIPAIVVLRPEFEHDLPEIIQQIGIEGEAKGDLKLELGPGGAEVDQE